LFMSKQCNNLRIWLFSYLKSLCIHKDCSISDNSVKDWPCSWMPQSLQKSNKWVVLHCSEISPLRPLMAHSTVTSSILLVLCFPHPLLHHHQNNSHMSLFLPAPSPCHPA
jgi:hypothetical protein